MPTQDDALIHKMTIAREQNIQNQIDGLTKRLDRLAKEWSIAKLLKEKDEERTIFQEMKEIQSEIKLLEKKK